jgi:hypothetical protein
LPTRRVCGNIRWLVEIGLKKKWAGRSIDLNAFVGFQMTRAKALTIGISLALTTAGILVYLIFFADEFHSRLFLTFVIVFQLSFIWTCAEILDRPDRPSDSR